MKESQLREKENREQMLLEEKEEMMAEIKDKDDEITTLNKVLAQ